MSENAARRHTAAPTISTQPQSATVADGGSVTFDVVASGSQPLIYQWMMNGQPVPGGTGIILRIGVAVLAESGASITVIVRINVGCATSSAASLTVDPLAPSIAV